MEPIRCFLLKETGRSEQDLDYPAVLHAVYLREDTGEEMTYADAPVGAMLIAPGGSLVVKVPGRRDGTGEADWSPSQPDPFNPSGWTLVGDPPAVTADAAIFMDRPRGWHGYLRNGFLIPA